MRDIRTDLNERLKALDGQHHNEMAAFDSAVATLRREHYDRIDKINHERDALMQLLAIENAREGVEPVAAARRRLVPLVDFLVAKACTQGPMSREELKTEAGAAGYFEDVNGRTFNTTLMNAVRGGKIAEHGGAYSAPAIDPSLFNNEREGEMQTMM